MIIGIGIDIVDIDRIKNIIEKWGKHFINKIYTESEIIYCNSKANPYQHYAARFAAKEAFYKALPKNKHTNINWKDIEVIISNEGYPTINFKREITEFSSPIVHLSLSHSSNNAIAMVIIENKVQF